VCIIVIIRLIINSVDYSVAMGHHARRGNEEGAARWQRLAQAPECLRHRSGNAARPLAALRGRPHVRGGGDGGGL